MKVIRVTTIPLSLSILLKGQLKYLNKYFEIIGLSSSGEALNAVEKDEGIRIASIEMNRGISPLRDIVSLFKLYLFFRKERPVIVHSITPKAGLLSMLAGKMANVPIRIHTFTGLIFPSRTGLLQKILIVMDKLLCWSATNIYPEGKGVMKDLQKYNITNKPLKVIANGNVNGIDLDYFNPLIIAADLKSELKTNLGIEENDFVFLFVGRLVGDKGINELISAFKILQNTPQISKNIKLLLVGSLESELDPLKQETLTEIELNPNIISVGFQKDVRSYFSVSDVLVFPSYREGFPNVVIQAGAMGLPAIVSDINGCNEIIIDGENGIIIPVKDVDSIKDSMITLKNNAQYYHALKKNTRKLVEERYEQKMVWSRLLEEYKFLMENKGIKNV